MKFVEIFTDGACSGNPGPGGWGAVLKYNGKVKKISGGAKDTTNNRMELTAVLEALGKLKEPCKVTITTDSKYICDAINQGWLDKWKSNGWVKSDKKPVLNFEYWEMMIDMLQLHDITFVWVKGHAGHPENEECDRMAVAECEKYK
ncbi:MAG: ribonuclease HI [Acutalibacteraceae bacterium]|nr:ribonuclease HI [Acutalibacteraceae bacterium]